MAKSVQHFRGILEEESSKLNGLCKEWEDVLHRTSESTIFSEEVCGQIRSAIGLAHLLVNQRFKQFNGLIKDCEDGKTPKVTLQDLEGFWEMIYFQVEDIYKKFKELTIVRDELSL